MQLHIFTGQKVEKNNPDDYVPQDAPLYDLVSDTF